MVLVEIFNKLTKRDVGTFMVCGKHLAELKATHIPSMFNIRHLTHGFVGECQMCIQGETTPITFDKTPDYFDLHVTFENDECESGWSASGTIGKLKYITDNSGNIYNTKEALYRRGVRRIQIESGFEIHIDEEPIHA